MKKCNDLYKINFLRKDGVIIPISQNFKLFFDHVKINISYNLISKKIQIFDIAENKIIDDHEHQIYLNDYLLLNNLPKLTLKMLRIIAMKNKINPIRDYFINNSWDGVSRLDAFVNCLNPVDFDKAKKFLIKWMILAIDVHFKKENESIERCILVLKGDSHSYKSTFLKNLCFFKEYYCTQIAHNFNDVDVKNKILKNWIVNLSIVHKILTKKLERKKLFLLKNEDKIKFFYDCVLKNVNRTTVFCSDICNFQISKTYEYDKLYYPFLIVDIKPNTIININNKIDIKQVWLEIYEKYRALNA